MLGANGSAFEGLQVVGVQAGVALGFETDGLAFALGFAALNEFLNVLLELMEFAILVRAEESLVISDAWLNWASPGADCEVESFVLDHEILGQLDRLIALRCESCDLGFDFRKLHFFDLETGSGIYA